MDDSEMGIWPKLLSRLLFLFLVAWIFSNFILPPLVRKKRPKVPQARMEINNLIAALDQYHAETENYPFGTTAEICRVLYGENPAKLVFFTANPKRVGASGELMDPWNTPYEIQILGQTNYIIRSAGPNRIFGDKDDLELSTK